jgi:glycosyltransferase involved in cell wall biosynthesis
MGSRFLNALARSIGRIKADVYHSFTPDVPRIQTCPVVPTIHDLSFELDPVVRRTTAGRDLHRITAQSVQYARRLIAISSQTKYDIASIYRLPPERIDVVYNGIDPAFNPPLPTELPTHKSVHLANNIRPPYILAVGADIPRRNYARLLKAMAIVWKNAAEHSDAARTHWVLAGRDDWNLSNIYQAAREAGLLDRLRFVRSPGNVDLADLYRSATLTCCASSFEGFGLSVLESMACGTAVACSDMRSLREVAEDAAVYFPHDDPPAMGEAIAGLLEDAEYRRQLKYRGIYRASLFTWKAAAQLTLDSLTTAVES